MARSVTAQARVAEVADMLRGEGGALSALDAAATYLRPRLADPGVTIRAIERETAVALLRLTRDRLREADATAESALLLLAHEGEETER